MGRKAAKATTYAPCTDSEGHLFMLPPPNGRVSVGTCQRCGCKGERLAYPSLLTHNSISVAVSGTGNYSTRESSSFAIVTLHPCLPGVLRILT